MKENTGMLQEMPGSNAISLHAGVFGKVAWLAWKTDLPGELGGSASLEGSCLLIAALAASGSLASGCHAVPFCAGGLL